MLANKLKMHMAIHKCKMFKQDGAACHCLKLLSDFLKKKNIKTLDWSGNSQDLSPIENLWALLKDKVANEHPTNPKDLETTIKCTWMQKITAEYFKYLVHSMPCLLHFVIKNEDGLTKY